MEEDSPIFGDEYSPAAPESAGESAEDSAEESEEILEVSESEEGFLKDYETKKKKYKTTPVLTKYERARIIGERANQISNGSKSLLQTPEKNMNAYEMALAELYQKKIPFIVKRPYGNTFEYWKLEDLL